ncbi:MAG: SRPBCC family protein [Myxococcota bacterium]|nr:SRPBCC family protein [Myxococcota bacterium]
MARTTKASRKIIINTSPETLFQVITDYEKYPQFLKEVSNIEILSTNGNSVKARYTVNFIKKVQYILELKAQANHSVQWSLVESGMMKVNNGSWSLRDLGNGTTEATYSVEVVPKGLFVPKKIVSMLTDGSLPATLNAFKKRAESM